MKIKNSSILYLLKGISNMEGPILNIVKTDSNKLYFEFYNNYPLLDIKEKKDCPLECYMPIHIFKETTIRDIKELLSVESLNKNNNTGPYLKDIMKLEDYPIYLDISSNESENFLETNLNNQYIKKRLEEWFEIWNNLKLLDGLNWNFDNLKNKEQISDFIFKNLDLKY